MAEQVALRTGATIAQPIWYGSHPYHHIGMPGTIVIPEDIFTGYVRGVIAGFWNAGFRKQILLNGHGQEYVIPVAIHQFAKIYQVPAILINVNWYHAIPDLVKDKEHGGPFETPFIHADEVETSFSMALFPEMIDKEAFEDTEPWGYLPKGHIDKAGNVYQMPIRWYEHVGGGPVEVYAYPPGVVGKPSLAEPEKAKPGLEALLDYLERLIDDVLERFPPGKLPPIEQMTQRPREEVEAVLKGPFERGGRHLYTLHYPP
ncbi:TPA: creatininase family protein, partial [Candidatus Bathyarchaeota archaeon]|nr:creatininase family protein [Candidatus Bathyarchaeota archaeon]